MRTPILCVLLGFATTSLFALPDYDPFKDATASGGTSYTVGSSLIGQVNDQGLTWYQAGATGTQPHPVIASGNLTVPGLAATYGNSVSWGNGSGDSARLGLGTTVSSGTLYYSMAFEVTALGGLTTAGAIAAGFNNSSGSQTGQPTVIGSSLEIRLSGSGYNLGINKGTVAGNTVWDTADTFALGTTLFLVGSYTFNTGSSTDDSSSLWINPDPSTFGAGSAPATSYTESTGSDITGPDIASFLVREASTIEPNMTLDELRVGSAWADVTPVPEPSALTIGALGALLSTGLLARRQRRK